MKKKLILLLSTAFLLAGCGGSPEGEDPSQKDDPVGPTPCSHVDSNHDGKCDLCQADMEINHIDDDHDHKCDVCEAKTSDHTYVNGYCTYCGARDPDYNLFYLPSKISKFNSEVGGNIYEYTFEYDDDFLGYKMKTVEIGYDSINVKSYRFNEDFSELTFIEEDVLNDVVSDGVKEVYHYLGGKDYSKTVYWYDYDLSDYIFAYENTYFYNSFNRRTLKTSKCYDTDIQDYVYTTYIVTEYDELGFTTRNTEYSRFTVGEEPSEIDYYTTYLYNEDYTSCFEESYYNNYEEILKDGYAVTSISQEDGVIKFNQQIYNNSGERTNNNKFEYRASDWTPIYEYYGGIPQEEFISIRDDNKITAYHNQFEDKIDDVKVTYDEFGKFKESEYSSTYVGSPVSYVDTATYIYNDYDQLSKIECNNVRKDGEIIEPQYYEIATVEYSTLQNDILLEHMEYVDNLVASFTDWAIFEGI